MALHLDELKMATASSCQQPDLTITLMRKRMPQQLPTPPTVHHEIATLLPTIPSSTTLRRRLNVHVDFETPVCHLWPRSLNTTSPTYQLAHGVSIASTGKVRTNIV
jgi:hypothetical protein